MKSKLKYLICKVSSIYYRFLNIAGIKTCSEAPVHFVVEKADWAISWVGTYICNNINDEYPGLSKITTRPAKIINRIVHFGSQYQWLHWQPHIARDNKVVVSFFHGKRDDSEEVNRHIDLFLNSVGQINYVVTGAKLIRKRLIGWGVDSDKVIRIPIGCDTTYFKPPSVIKRYDVREKFGIKEDMVCIGSFQKDGVGWGEGMIPKLIKGPDVFVSSVKRLSKEVPVFVLLSGPARGYVKHQLKENNIPYYHEYVENYQDILDFYHALDLYLVTSREEGGPMALMESMSTHVPIVSTRVGQAEDLIENKINGGLVNVDDVDAMCESAIEIIKMDDFNKNKQLENARQKVVKHFDWKIVAKEHYEKVYSPLLNEF